MGATAKVADFTSVKDRGNFNPKRVPEGDYAAVITKVEDGKSKKNDEFQYIFTLKLKKYSQYSYPYYCQLTESQLWKIRNLLIAAGLNVPKKRMKLDPNKAVGKTVGVTMEDDEYDGKMKSVIGSIFPQAELSDSVEPSDGDDDDNFDEEQAPVMASDDEDDEPKPKKKKAKKEPEADAEDEAPKKAKKKKSKKSEENLEELDITEL